MTIMAADWSPIPAGSALPVLTIVVPCYNEAIALPQMAPRFKTALQALIDGGQVAAKSRILLVDDGSSDATWRIIEALHGEDPAFAGIALSRNRGQQHALLCGMLESRGASDIVVTADCDGQDDLSILGQMVAAWREGAEIVYACRDSRANDTWFKRTCATWFYRSLARLGAEVVFDHADYRLVSARALAAMAEFGEVNLFLRGLFPLLGFKTARVYYTRQLRIAGDTHYPFLKMLGFAADGITSLSIRPLRAIWAVGAVAVAVAVGLAIAALVALACGRGVAGWMWVVLCMAVFGGLQLMALGIVGEYVGKTYLEAKHRPRYLVERRLGLP